MKDFLNFNQVCPICQEPLTLYMQWSGDAIDKDRKLFIAKNEEDVIRFEEHKFGRKNVSFKSKFSIKKNNVDISMDLKRVDDNYIVNFNSLMNEKNAKNQEEIYFFFLCNPKAIEDLGYDYEINSYNGCYYRSSALIKFHHLNYNNSKLYISFVDEMPYINRAEYFVLKNRIDDLEKVYTLILNNEESKTVLMYYSVTDEQALNDDFEANIFEKEMPILKNRPSFDQADKEKLIERLDGWIILS